MVSKLLIFDGNLKKLILKKKTNNIETNRYEITTNLSNRVSFFNPAWNDRNTDSNVINNCSTNFKILADKSLETI